MVTTKEVELVDRAKSVFMRYGIKSINMDDMARHLGISKKTLYQYFTDKEDLLKKSVALHCTNEDREIKEICHRGLNAIDEMLEIMHWVLNILRDIHPSVQYDLEKYHHAIYQAMKTTRDRAIFDCMVHNMRKGQREGLYRKDFNPEVICKIYISRLDDIFNPSTFPFGEFTLSELYKESFNYHIRGIASQKGLDYLREKLKTMKKDQLH
jgi:AcrR family transcriptional regulator